MVALVAPPLVEVPQFVVVPLVEALPVEALLVVVVPLAPVVVALDSMVEHMVVA